MKRALGIVFAVALLTVLLVGWFAPGLIAWYYSPPVELGVTCKPAVEWGIAVYRKTLLAGTAAGFILGAIAAGLWARAFPPKKLED